VTTQPHLATILNTRRRTRTMNNTNQAFVVDSDVKAEWALKKIKEEKAECNRFVAVCQEMINDYMLRIETAQTKLESDISYLRQQLMNYFNTVEKRATKTQESYRLPSGTLILKKQNPDFVRDHDKLLQSVKALGLTSYVKSETEEFVDWSALKATLTVANDKVLTADGEIVEGVTVVPKPDIFEVKL
jgi:predicted component of type VI protein secretion system